MKTSPLRSWSSRRIPGLLLVVAVVSALGSCALGDQELPELPESPEGGMLSARSPELAAMVELASEAPPERTSDGHVVRSLPRAEHDPRGWNAAAHGISVAVDEQSGRLSIASTRHVSVSATRLGAASSSSAAIEGSALMQRDAEGNLRSVLLARPTGVEDLLIVDDRSSPAGYELELPLGWSLRQPAGFVGLVEIRDSRERPRLRIVANVAWDAHGTRWPVEARLDGRRVLFSVSEDAPLPLIVDPEWQDTGSPVHVRARASATVLQDGKLLVIGGLSGNDEVLSGTVDVLCSTEIYDPFDLSWQAGPPLQAPGESECTPLMDHVAVPLPDGTVLVAGGANRASLLGAKQPAALSRAWRYSPSLQTFEPTGSLLEARVHHTATLLGSGKVLIAGGSDRLTPLQEESFQCPKNAETGELCQRCVGKSSAELYDPASGTFSIVAMPTARSCHTATLIAGDRVVLIGGGGQAITTSANGETGEPVARLSVFEDGAFSELTTKLNSPRFGHVAVLRPDTGQILVALGRNALTLVAPPLEGAVLAELIDLASAFSAAPPEYAQALPCEAATCPRGRSYAAAVLSSTGRVLIAGGQEVQLSETKPSDRVDAFDFGSPDQGAPDAVAPGFVTPPAQLLSPVSKPILATLPTGKIMLVGQTAPAELLEDSEWTFALEESGPLQQGRGWQSATPLPDGTVLIAGGFSGDLSGDDSEFMHDSAEIFDTSTLTSSLIASPMQSRRAAHSATFLPAAAGQPARVLLTGGAYLRVGTEPYNTSSAELYDPATQTFTATGSMHVARAFHAAVRLPSGQVLITGGLDEASLVGQASAELWDPASGQFTSLPPMAAARLDHTATLLSSGRVLISGGFTAWSGNFLVGETTASEIFDPVTQTFHTVGPLVVARAMHTASVLPSGQVLIAGGSTVSASGEIFDPESESFRLTEGFMDGPRLSHAATTLPSGKVLISGGGPSTQDQPRKDAELFDPASEQFELLPAPEAAPDRFDHDATLLPNGYVALYGGSTNGLSTDVTTNITLLAPTGAQVSLSADVLSVPGVVQPGSAYPVQGSALAAFWETSSGPYTSPTGAPISVWVPSSGAPTLGTFAPWSEDDTVWTAPSSPFAGDGVLYAVRHGQSGAGRSVELSLAPDGVPCSGDGACASGFCADGVCCNEACHVAGDGDTVCRACSVARGAEVDGVCSFVPDGADPHEDCGTSPECTPKFAVCGGDGQCKECLCESTLDCAAGYSCTAGGTCEPSFVPDGPGGCAIQPDLRADGRRAGALALLLAGLVLVRRGARRRV